MRVLRGVYIALIVFMLPLGGCAGVWSAPAGDDTQNEEAFDSADDLKNRVAQLQPGMDKALVFSILGHAQPEFTQLDRPAITETLYGGSGSAFSGTLDEQERARLFLQSLEGYRMNFRETDRDIGFSSPIRIRRDEEGHHYILTLIFRDGKLFDAPSLSGGPIKGSSSKTFFDFLSPGMLLDI